MTIHSPLDPHDDDFESLLSETEVRRCMFDLDGPCDNAPVRGHFIQKGLLKLIQDSRRRVMFFSNLRATSWEELGVEYSLSRPVPLDDTATREFLCVEHEKFFWPIENPEPNWDDSKHRALLAYRAVLINRYMKEWFIKLWSQDPHLPGENHSLKEQLLRAAPLEAAIREYLHGTVGDQLRHEVARIPRRPMLAASGVFFHPLVGTIMRDGRNGGVIPVPSSPIVITVLPAKKAQMVMFSYTRDGVLDVRDLLDALEYRDGFISTAKLSKKLLEEIEFIQMSPTAWASLGESNQEFIKWYVMHIFGISENEFDVSPSQVDLWAGK